MKRAIALLLTVLLSVLLQAALAETAVLPDDGALPENTPVAADLDGDGADETVSWFIRLDEFDGLTLTVTPASGEAVTYETDILDSERVLLLDVDGDGGMEVLLSGDEMSDDYFTYCLRWLDGALYEILFPDANRGENTPGYFKYGYGALVAVDGGALTLSGSQDVLGTWFAQRTVALSPAGHFEFCDDGLWTRIPSDPDDADVWEYAALTTAAELPYAGDDGAAGILPPGTRLMIVATDKRESARFITEDGLSGTLAISEDYARGWGWLVDGAPEDECFERLPYAD